MFSVLYQLEEQLPTAIGILNQALQVTDDMDLPAAPSLLSDPKKTEQTGQEKASGESTSEEGAESMQVDVVDNDKAKSEGDAKNGPDDCNGSNTVEKMDTATEEVFKVKKEDIIAQVCTYMMELLGVFL